MHICEKSSNFVACLRGKKGALNRIVLGKSAPHIAQKTRIPCVLVFLALIVCVACEPDTTCYNREMTTAMVVTLAADSTGTDGTPYSYTAWDSLYVQGVGAETVLYSRSAIQQIALSLRPDTTQTAFRMLYHGQWDTLVVRHTPRMHYVSMACGCAVYHTITDAYSTDRRVDSVAIINANVETTMQENLRIYLHE